MPQTLPPALEPYPNISSKAYEHPADRAATAALKSIPVLDSVVRKLIEWRYERALRQFYLGNSVKASEHQLPELYVSDAVPGGAQAIGAGKPMSVIDSDLLQRLSPAEQRVVAAHEVGHI